MVAVSEENTREALQRLGEAGVEVFVGAPGNVAGALQMLEGLARGFALRVAAPEAMTKEVLGPAERGYKGLYKAQRERRRRVFVPIWRGPYVSVRVDT